MKLTNCLKVLSVSILCSLLSACASDMNTTWPAVASASRDEIRFDFPLEEHWEVASEDHDSGGYSRAWRPASAEGAAAEQSFYINFGRGIHTPLTAAMDEVKRAMQAQGCKAVEQHVWARGESYLTFTVVARQCRQGRPVWQIFRVVNRPDGQYAMVYSANPDTVPVATRQQMAGAVERSLVVPK